MVEKILSPGGERKEIWANEQLTIQQTMPWVCPERLLSWTLVTKQPIHMILINQPRAIQQETVSSLNQVYHNQYIKPANPSDWLQTGCSQLAWDQWGDIQLCHWDWHLSHQNISPGSLCCLCSPSCPLHLHHVLLLYEEGHTTKSEGTNIIYNIIKLRLLHSFRNLIWEMLQYLGDKHSIVLWRKSESQWKFTDIFQYHTN